MVQTEVSNNSANGSQLPLVLKRRINALRNLQLKSADVEAKLSEELHKLEHKYSKMFEPMLTQREKIVNGEYEPTDEEATWQYDNEGEEGGEANGSASKKQKTNDKDQDIKGLPDFWLQTLRSNSLLSGLISEHDEPILTHLRDIRVKLADDKIAYSIEFHFNPNEYFTNTVLTKTFEMNTQRSKTNPLTGETSPLAKSLGTAIEWKEGKNVVEKLKQQLKKKQEQTTPVKGRGSKAEEADEDEDDEPAISFFSLFETRGKDGVNPLVSGQISPENIGELEELAHGFELDYEVGQVLKDVIVPKAVLYYTGELSDEGDDEFDDFGEDDEDDEDDDDEDDDDEDEEEERQRQLKKKKGGK